jgi:endonuclease YncB( thermonuclease family)
LLQQALSKAPSLRFCAARFPIAFCTLLVAWNGALLVAQDSKKEPAEEKELEVDLKKVIDGDSILVTDPKDNNKEYEVQVEGIDAPEAKQEFGKESTEGLTKLLGKTNFESLGPPKTISIDCSVRSMSTRHTSMQRC